LFLDIVDALSRAGSAAGLPSKPGCIALGPPQQQLQQVLKLSSRLPLLNLCAQLNAVAFCRKSGKNRNKP
jgi:hypothetical protein